VVEELIALAKEIREAGHRSEDLGLTEDETAFYDALETNDNAVDGLIREVRRFGLYSRSGRFFLPLSERLENIQPVIWTEFLEN
jgi:hypothetical protein